MGPWAHGTPKSMKVDYKIQQGHVPKSLGRVLNRKQKPLWDSPRPLNALRNIHIYIYIYIEYTISNQALGDVFWLIPDHLEHLMRQIEWTIGPDWIRPPLARKVLVSM